MTKKDAVNPRLLAAARTRAIFGPDVAQHLTPAQYRDYLSWVHIMVDIERQRMALRTAQLTPLSDSDPAHASEDEALEEEDLEQEALDRPAAA